MNQQPIEAGLIYCNDRIRVRFYTVSWYTYRVRRLLNKYDKNLYHSIWLWQAHAAAEEKKPHDEYDKALLAELERGEIVGPKDVPADVIPMNSQVRFKDEHSDDWEYWLVFPEDADLAKQKISILSPVGCALIGCQKGDKITLPTRSGRKELTVEEVIHQPEREGNFEL